MFSAVNCSHADLWLGSCGGAGHSRLFVFFQAEDGIRDHCVTGVQTCALPILVSTRLCMSAVTTATVFAAPEPIRDCATASALSNPRHAPPTSSAPQFSRATNRECSRSEERRVGKESTSGLTEAERNEERPCGR